MGGLLRQIDANTSKSNFLGIGVYRFLSDGTARARFLYQDGEKSFSVVLPDCGTLDSLQARVVETFFDRRSRKTLSTKFPVGADLMRLRKSTHLPRGLDPSADLAQTLLWTGVPCA